MQREERAITIKSGNTNFYVFPELDGGTELWSVYMHSLKNQTISRVARFGSSTYATDWVEDGAGGLID